MRQCTKGPCRWDGSELEHHVNLQLNPEGWTGYNGSHVWSAIYQENCLRAATSVDDMCYEERVLYRLLSGMHASAGPQPFHTPPLIPQPEIPALWRFFFTSTPPSTFLRESA